MGDQCNRPVAATKSSQAGPAWSERPVPVEVVTRDPSSVFQGPKPTTGAFPWTIVVSFGDPPALGAVGVCDDRDRAMRDLCDALVAAPSGAVGLLHKAVHNPMGGEYWYTGLLAEVRLNPLGDTVVVAEHEPTSSRGRPGDVFDQIAEAMQSAGLALVPGTRRPSVLLS